MYRRKRMNGKRRRRQSPLPFAALSGLLPKGEDGKMSTVGKLMNPAAFIGEQLGAGPGTIVGKLLNPLSIFNRGK